MNNQKKMGSMPVVCLSKCKRQLAWLMIMLLSLVCTACGNTTKKPASSTDTSFSVNFKSSEELYIFQYADLDKSVIHMVNVSTGAYAEMEYTGTTDILNSSKEPAVASQFTSGELIKVTYSTNNGKLISVHAVTNGWSYETLGRYLNKDNKLGALRVADNNYKFDKGLSVFSNEKLIQFEDINDTDEVIVRGVDKQAYSITVLSGHGTVFVTNANDYVGGWIEIGKTISTISNNMLLDVPEGDYQLYVTRKGYEGTMNVSVSRGEKTEIDLSQIKETKADTGFISFDVTPKDATIYINYSRVEGTDAVELLYGKYYLTIKAEGYSTYGGIMVVQSPSTTIKLELTKDSTSSSSSSSTGTSSASGSGGSSSGSSSSTSSTSTSDDASRSSVLKSLQDAQQSLQNQLFSMLN